MRLFLTAALCILAPLAAAEAPKPNVLLILSDDAGYADFGFHGASEILTPNIDRLARQGVSCSQAYVSASVCAPSRMGLMTGRYQQRFGAECNVPHTPTPGYTTADLGLEPSESTLGDVMKTAGYRTMMIGKWHLGENEPEHHPLRRGFDEFYGFLGGGRSYLPLPEDKPKRAGEILYHDHEALDEAEAVTYLTDDLTDAAIDFIDRSTEEPFFVYLSYNAVHTPMEAKTEDIEQTSAKISEEDRRIYAAMTQSMDQNIGRLHSHLEAKGLAENTLVVFINDNGGATSNASENNPLRGFKGSYWEGGIRIPFIANWPGVLPAGHRFEAPVSALDLLPTFAAVSGSPLETKPLDGKNLIPYLKGEHTKPPHQTLYWRLWQAAAIRHDDWKLIRIAENPLHEKPELIAPPILINLAKDPGETTNLATKHPKVTQDLLERLRAWESGLVQPRWYDGEDWQKWARVQVQNHKMDTTRYQ